MPRIADALERIADRMATAEQFTATLEQTGAPVDATAERVEEIEAGLPQKDGEAEEKKEKADAAKALRSMRIGLQRGADLVRAFDEQVVPGVSLHQQREILAFVASLVERYAGDLRHDE